MLHSCDFKERITLSSSPTAHQRCFPTHLVLGTSSSVRLQVPSRRRLDGERSSFRWQSLRCVCFKINLNQNPSPSKCTSSVSPSSHFNLQSTSAFLIQFAAWGLMFHSASSTIIIKLHLTTSNHIMVIKVFFLNLFTIVSSPVNLHTFTL